MESSTGFSKAPLKQHFTIFNYRTISFCCFPGFYSSEPFKPPSKDKQDFNIFREASSHVSFLFQRKSLLLELALSILSNSPPSPPPPFRLPQTSCPKGYAVLIDSIFLINQNQIFNGIIYKEFLFSRPPVFFGIWISLLQSPKKVHTNPIASHPPPPPKTRLGET